MAKLLLVEDDRASRNEIAKVLTNAGHEVLTAANVMQAHRHIREAKMAGEEFDIILCDHHLGQSQNGEAVFQYAWRMCSRDIPFIACSSEMKYWIAFQVALGAPPHFYPLPKIRSHWDTDKVPELVTAILEEAK